ncbi:hypothetical protein [Halorussus halobius]|uniref:hypothetical protein n=1 Tax=Halorussus halobius TaxID=1710537 RepID=UPI001092C5FC|nr:hypothetical protein [Halorussus halobius]
MSEQSTDGTEQVRIAHLFADHGVEAEVLAAHAEVHRFTIDPRPNEFVAETTEIDLMEEIPRGRFDLALLHPKCTKWADMPDVDPEDHDNQIPRARELGCRIADDYVIENKPRAPLEDAVVLHGRMFGLPLAYERAFEASFPILQPPQQQQFGEKTVSPYFLADRTTEWWKATKGYRGDYPKQHLAKNALPAAYVRFIVRSWLESRDTRDAEEVQDNNSPAPRTVPEDQAKLTDVSAQSSTDTEQQGGRSL